MKTKTTTTVCSYVFGDIIFTNLKTSRCYPRDSYCAKPTHFVWVFSAFSSSWRNSSLFQPAFWIALRTPWAYPRDRKISRVYPLIRLCVLDPSGVSPTSFPNENWEILRFPKLVLRHGNRERSATGFLRRLKKGYSRYFSGNKAGWKSFIHVHWEKDILNVYQNDARNLQQIPPKTKYLICSPIAT